MNAATEIVHCCHVRSCTGNDDVASGARKVGELGRALKVYCRYLFPRRLWQPESGGRGVVLDDPYRDDLRNLFLERNDSLLNNFEPHLLLMNMGNIDWRALLNLWSVLEYLTKYTAKGGQPSKHLGRVFEEVIENIFQWDEEDGVHDMWRRSIMKFYSRILGHRDYSLFEVLHFGLGLPGVLSSFGDVSTASVSNWAALKRGEVLAAAGFDARATHNSVHGLVPFFMSTNKGETEQGDVYFLSA